jgi:ADP-ribosylglycohydrolase
LTCGGRTYDFGNVNMMALYQYMITNNPYTAITTDHSAGTGSFIRVAPIGLFYATNPLAIHEYARDTSRITHGAIASIHACQIAATLIARTLFCQDKTTLFADYWFGIPADAAVRTVLSSAYSTQQRGEFKGSYVIEALDTVCHGLLHYDDFASGALALANLGGMQGAACTVYGQIAGALYGESAIPLHWRQKLTRYHEIAWYADTLLRVAWNSLPHTDQIPAHLFSET